MALVLVEGFDHLAANQMTAKGWSTNAGSVQTGRLGGQCFRFTTSTISGKLLPSSYTTLIAGVAFRTASSVSNGDFLTLLAGGINGTAAVRLGLNASNQIIVRNSGGTIIATGTTAIAANTWHYYEIKAFINGASGTCEVHLDGNSGSPEIASTVGNFGSTNLDTVRIGGTNTTVDWDDLVVLDTSGSAPNNTFLGDVRVETLLPNGAGAHSQWTPSTGSNWQNVDDATPDDDSTYNYDATVGDRDSYTFGDLSELSGTIFGVQTNLYARKDSTATRQLCAVARPSTTDYDGATATLTTSYGVFSEIRATNPDTSSAWTISDVNGSEFGVKVVT